jgi:hypothetical protein
VFTQDSIWLIELTTSRNLYDPDSKSLPIDDAIVTIIEINGQSTCDMFHQGNGIYQSMDCYPEKSHRYKLIVESPKYGKVTATSNVPTGGLARVQQVNNEEGEINIQIELQDSSLLKNHFIWDLVEVTVIEEVTKEVTGGIEKINIGGWLDGRGNNNPIKTGTTSGVSSAELINNQGIISSTLSARSGDIKSETVLEEGQIITKKTMLRVMTVSAELFNYYKSIEDYIIYEGYQTSFEEPIKTYSNIDGGTGLFAGFTVQYLDFQ